MHDAIYAHYHIVKLYSQTIPQFTQLLDLIQDIKDVTLYKKIIKDATDKYFLKYKEDGGFLFDRFVSSLGFSTDVEYTKELLEETIKGTITPDNKLYNIPVLLSKIMKPSTNTNHFNDEFYI